MRFCSKNPVLSNDKLHDTLFLYKKNRKSLQVVREKNSALADKPTNMEGDKQER